MNEDLEEKKVLGSGGYAFVYLTENAEITYENPNEEITEGLVLLEKGEYKCRTCKNIIAQYRKFNK